MIVISDAAPLRYLTLIDQIHLLREIYGHVVLPQAVSSELQQEKTPEKVRAWMAELPDWMEVRVVSAPDMSLRLGAGEREALTLAGELQDTLLLIDERKAARIARDRGIPITGTLGVLEEGAKRDLIDLPEAIGRLRTETNFRGTPKLYEASLERDRKFRHSRENSP
jgi:predicted nucleic acid-binding protein